MTQREKHRSAFLLIGWAMLCVCAAPAGADTITVSGQFGSGVTADQFAAPDALWALSFTADSNPAAANPDAFPYIQEGVGSSRDTSRDDRLYALDLLVGNRNAKPARPYKIGDAVRAQD